MRPIQAYGPAGVGNLAAGFDTLGAALAPLLPAPGGQSSSPLLGDPAGMRRWGVVGADAASLWGDLVEVTAAAEGDGAAPGTVSLSCAGPFAAMLPADPRQNLVLAACAAFSRHLGRPLPAIAVRLYKGLPVGGGLGSSSATIVAVLRAVNALAGQALDNAHLLRAAGEAEASAAGGVVLDNVAAALLGGLQLVDAAGGAHRLPFPPELCFVLASPATSLTTRAARAAMPQTVPLGLAVAHAQNLAALVHALHEGDRALLRACLVDRLAEPSRAPLVAGFREVQAAALAAGAWGCTYSGAGPAMFALADAATAPAVGEAMAGAWAAAGLASAVRLCGLDPRGARVLGDACD